MKAAYRTPAPPAPPAIEPSAAEKPLFLSFCLSIAAIDPLPPTRQREGPRRHAGRPPRRLRPVMVRRVQAGTCAVKLPTASPTRVEDGAIRPFTIHVPEDALADMRWRIATTKWPSRETVNDSSHGVQLAMVQDIARYWQTELKIIDPLTNPVSLPGWV